MVCKDWPRPNHFKAVWFNSKSKYWRIHVNPSQQFRKCDFGSVLQVDSFVVHPSYIRIVRNNEMLIEIINQNTYDLSNMSSISPSPKKKKSRSRTFHNTHR